MADILYCAVFTQARYRTVDIAAGTVGGNLLPQTAVRVAVSPNNQWVAFSTAASQLYFLNLSTGILGAVVNTGLVSTFALAWAPDSSKVFVTDGSGNGLQWVNPTGMSFGPVWTLDAVQGDMVMDAAGAHLYVCCGTHVRQVNPSTGAVTASYTVPASYGLVISPDQSTLWVTDQGHPTGHIYPIDIATSSVGAGIVAGDSPCGIVISPDGSKVWVSELSSNQVQAFYTATGAPVSPLGWFINQPYNLAITQDGSQVWAASFSNQIVMPINTATLIAGSNVNISDFANGMAFGPPPGTVGPPTGTATVVLGPLTITATSTITGSTVTGTATLNLGPFTVSATDHITTRVGTATVVLGPLRVAALGARQGPRGFPIPGFRGRWRLTLHTRQFAAATLMSSMIAELADARGRRLEQQWNQPAQLTFTLDGHSQAAGLVQELFHDVVAWRWDDQTGSEFAVFRGPVLLAEDQLGTESHTVTYTCHDYSAVLSRRILTGTSPYSVTGRDQDLIVGDLLSAASTASTSSGVSLSPASYLPLSLVTVHADGTTRGLSGVNRNRTYYGSQNVLTAIDDLAKVINGYDYDVQPDPAGTADQLRVFFPAQGVNRTDVTLQYGSSIASLTRTVNSADYSNYVRVLGNNTSTSPSPQMYGEDWGPTALATTTPVGLWMTADNAADATVQQTLDNKASGDLILDQILLPHYSLLLTPDAYTWGNPNMGDNVGLIIQSGRLDVNTLPPSAGIRVLGISYDIGDDGQEDVTLTVGRPRLSLGRLLTSRDRDIAALTRR